MDTYLTTQIPDLLLPWYRAGHRDLPWRRDREPYHIWISEIMLQQTRAAAAQGYYLRFLQELPNLHALAQCEEERLLKLWEGLGYYNRARNLQKCAQVLLRDHGGQFPQTAAQLEKLPGIGPYTAGAIASIAFDRPAPAIDGNVLRVMTRLTGDDTPLDHPDLKKRIHALLLPLYTPGSCADLTQALMELGATVCLPGPQAKCAECPCRRLCVALAQGKAELLPVPGEKKPRREEERTVFLLRCGSQVALGRREREGLLAGLWEFPNVAGFLEPAQAVQYLLQQGLRPTNIVKIVEKKHIFTHITWKMRGIVLDVEEPDGPYTWMELAQVDAGAALPTAFRQFRGDFEEETT